MLDKEKKRFHEMAEKDKARYDLEMQNYVPPKGVVLGRGKKRKQIKDPNAPKRSLYVFRSTQAMIITSSTKIAFHLLISYFWFYFFSFIGRPSSGSATMSAQKSRLWIQNTVLATLPRSWERSGLMLSQLLNPNMRLWQRTTRNDMNG